jgi:hypothetical protein
MFCYGRSLIHEATDLKQVQLDLAADSSSHNHDVSQAFPSRHNGGGTREADLDPDLTHGILPSFFGSTTAVA